MKEYHTTIDINASKEKVWQALTDFQSYPDWNPLVSKLSGDIKEGGLIRTTIVPLGNTFSAELISFKQANELVWQGKWIAGFLLAGTHYYRLDERMSHTTTLNHGEHFTGFLTWFLPGKLMRKMASTFVHHNEALKKRVENET